MEENKIYVWNPKERKCLRIELSIPAYHQCDRLMTDFWNDKYFPTVEDFIKGNEYYKEKLTKHDIEKLEPYKKWLVDINEINF